MTTLVHLDRVTRDFGATRAVDGVSLTVEPGEVVGLLGANGAGKTTCIRMLMGLLAPTGGTVHLLGGAPARSTRRELGYVPQGLGLYADLTAAENLAFRAAAFGIAVPAVPGDLAHVADVVVGDLSLGVRRRLAFTAALAHDPRLLVLDEPTSGVGPLGRADLWGRIHAAVAAGAGALVTTHHMDEAEQCDRLVVLAGGRTVAAGAVTDVVGDEQVVEVTTDRPGAVLARLEDAGLVALPAGRRVRVVGAAADRVRDVVGAADLAVVGATLEEAVIAVDGRERGRDRDRDRGRDRAGA